MAAVTAAALLALLAPVTPLQVTVTDPRTVALLFQPVLLRCQYRTVASDPPIVTWKYKSFCPQTAGDSAGGGSGGSWQGGDVTDVTCPDGATRTVRIVATKQGDTVTLGDFYRGRGVTIRGEAELSLGPAAWGDSGLYVCTVTTTQDLGGNNEATAELVVLASMSEATDLLPGFQLGTLPDWLFVVLVGLGVLLGALVLGLCWCQCCPHTCCCLLRCPCCPQRCCCPEALYLAGKAATSGAMGGAYSQVPPHFALQTLGSSQSSQVPLLREEGAVPPPGPPPAVLRYLEQQIGAIEPHGRCPPPRAGPPPSDISSLHEAPDAWDPPDPPPSPPSPDPPRGRWRSAELLGGGGGGGWGGATPPSRPRSRSRDDLLVGGGGEEPLPRRPPGPPRRLRKQDALSRESLVV